VASPVVVMRNYLAEVVHGVKGRACEPLELLED
jgi:hypothetical protein